GIGTHAPVVRERQGRRGGELLCRTRPKLGRHEGVHSAPGPRPGPLL
ncbi:MAG: hypothetical protein AVDCRST_MAG33-537, partial [uncultured Thermomicrobiales bacterium]